MSTSRTDGLTQVAERPAPRADEFRNEVVAAARPAVLRGAARNWPVVAAARRNPHSCLALLAAHANGLPVDVLRADPEEEGRFHYRPGAQALNFVRGEAPLRAFLGALREHEMRDRPDALVAQGLLAERYFPGFASTHTMPLVPASAEPRLWIGNASRIATHNDPTDNLAVVAAGRRRFTLFPPEAEPDLYMGPNRPTPAGTPVSMVHVTAPDLERFPRFAAALERAEEADLDPGDAIFIPRNWFHHVEALERFNLLVNYWWDSSRE